MDYPKCGFRPPSGVFQAEFSPSMAFSTFAEKPLISENQNATSAHVQVLFKSLLMSSFPKQ